MKAHLGDPFDSFLLLSSNNDKDKDTVTTSTKSSSGTSTSILLDIRSGEFESVSIDGFVDNERTLAGITIIYGKKISNNFISS